MKFFHRSKLIFTTFRKACRYHFRLNAVPEEFTEYATIPDITNARIWFDRDLSTFIQTIIQDDQREKESFGTSCDDFPVSVLAISGGGDNGAFAAGVLGGLSASGQRPYFKVVTGISTGALIAPFAFLGTPYDDILQTVATSVGPNKIFQHRNIFMGLAKDGMANSKPLAKILKQYITPEILNLVAKEYRKGRVLQIGTTDLDSGRQVIWNMGEIASSNSPNALELFCKIIIASASIPGVVSPVMIDVEVNRKKYQEMHVDGGVVSQVFLYPATLMEELERVTGKHLSREVHMYVIRNGRLKSNWSETKKRTLSIGGRAINILIQSQGINDLLHLFQIAKQDNVDFNLAYIGEDFNVEHAQEFDRHYMQKLYEYGFNFAATHQQWHKSLPKEVLMR